MIQTQPKQIGRFQNDWYSTKIIWTVQNPFGPIEGQGINPMKSSQSKFQMHWEISSKFCGLLKNPELYLEEQQSTTTCTSMSWSAIRSRLV